MARIYISSTYSDLVGYREAVYQALRGMQHDAIAMEDYRAEGHRPLHKCMADIETCDLYIGIFAWRYGYIPAQNNPEGKSISEREYRKAREVGKACLVFLLDEKAAWPLNSIDMVTGEGNRGAYITALRQELQQNVLGLVRGEGIKVASDWFQSTANSILDWFFAHLTTPVYS